VKGEASGSEIALARSLGGACVTTRTTVGGVSGSEGTVRVTLPALG